MAYDTALKYTLEYLRGCTELGGLLRDAQQTLLDLETDKAQQFGFTKKPHLFSRVKKDIARIKTIIRQKRQDKINDNHS